MIRTTISLRSEPWLSGDYLDGIPFNPFSRSRAWLSSRNKTITMVQDFAAIEFPDGCLPDHSRLQSPEALALELHDDLGQYVCAKAPRRLVPSYGNTTAPVEWLQAFKQSLTSPCLDRRLLDASR